MAAEICLLLAAERSGTHLLRSLLANIPGVVAPAEVCNVSAAGARRARAGFHRFRRLLCEENPDFYFPTEPAQSEMLDRYFTFLRAEFPRSTMIVVDVKYSHVHNFNFYWWDLSERPYLLEFARKRHIKIIHLVRRKAYRTAISTIYASHSGVWRARAQEDLKDLRITVDLRKLERKAVRLARAIGQFEYWLGACPAFQITYEELTGQSEAELGKLQNFLELPARIENRPGFIRTTPSLETSIENFEEIAPLIDLDWRQLEIRAPSQRGP
ncbi:MAG TPA: sulfotransferase [Rhizomicrobium sp.]|jgi:LPS sulfotransferase NodH